MRVLIIGCGYVGAALAQRLVAGGHTVRGVTISEESAASLAQAGISACVADCSTSAGAREAWREKADAVVFSMSSRGGDYQRTYVDGMTNVLRALQEHPPSQFIYTGSTSVYSQTGGEWVTEASPSEPSNEKGRCLLRAEQLVKDASIAVIPSTCVLRLAAIYGPGRHVLLDRLRSGIAVLPGDGTHWMNQVHRDDIVAALELLIKKSPRPDFQVLNVTDDTPVRQREFVEWCCEKLVRPVPTFQPGVNPDEFPSRKGFQAHRRVANGALRALGWTPQFPSFKEGLERLLEKAP